MSRYIDDVMLDCIRYRILKGILRRKDTGKMVFPDRSLRPTFSDETYEVRARPPVKVYEWHGLLSYGDGGLDDAVTAIMHSRHPENLALIRQVMDELGFVD